MASGTILQDWAGGVYVTAANPAPGRDVYTPYVVPSGTGYETFFTTASDGGPGVNVYLAGGTGPSGSIPVSQTNPVQVSLSGVSISGIIEVTTSAGNPLFVTGTLALDPSGVFVLNLPATQTVALDSPVPLPVTGSVAVVGTATVAVDSLPQPLEVTGAVSVSNFPDPQSVSITASIPLVITSSQTYPVWITGVSLIPTSSSNTQYTYSTSTLSVLPENDARTAFTIYNDASGHLLIRFGPSASLSSWDTRIPTSGYYESPYPCWCGEVTILGRDSGSGYVYVGEQA
jgi:hypothetical protein